MEFNISAPGLIILNQYTTYISHENIHNYWYVSTDGIDYFRNNIGNLSELHISTESLLDLITKNFKNKFEFAFDKVDLGFFQYWSCLQIQFHSKQNKGSYTNIQRFLESYQFEHTFDEQHCVYQFKNFPHVTSHFDVYNLINKTIENELQKLFKVENIAHCTLNMDDFKSFSNHDNKIEFLEKFRLKSHLEEQFPVKKSTSLKKI